MKSENVYCLGLDFPVRGGSRPRAGKTRGGNGVAQHSHAGDRRLTLRDVPWDLPHLGRLLPGVLVSAGAGLVGLSWGAGLLPLAWALPAGLGVVVAGLWRAVVVGRAEGTAQVAAAEKGRQLEVRNHQLQVVLQATQSLSGELDEAAVLAALVQQVTRHTRFARAAVVLGPDGEGSYAVAVAAGMADDFRAGWAALVGGPNADASPVGVARRTAQPVLIEDVQRDQRAAACRTLCRSHGAPALIAVPMQVQDRFQGALVAFADQPLSIGTVEVSLFAAIVGQGALALENARLYTLTQANRRRLDRAVEFMQNVSAGLTRTRVGVLNMLRLTAQAIAGMFEPASVFIVIQRDRHGGRPLVVHDHAGVDSEAAVRGRALALEGNLASSGLVNPWPAALSVPVVVDGMRTGHFEIYLAGQGRRVLPEELSILHAFVHLTASALGNAHLVSQLRQAVDEVERAYMGTLEALTKALEMRDHETQGHSRRVVEYTLALAQRLGVAEEQLVPMIRGALLHDIGKIGIPDSILRKPGPLTEDEWAIMRTHTYIGYHMLKQIDFLASATPIILHHHERFDGSGYPLGLVGVDIPMGARVFSVADAYDAITSDRPYKKARTHDWALAEIERGAGAHFDPAVVEALLSLPEEELARIRNRDLELHTPPR